jgi:hypothetical protein
MIWPLLILGLILLVIGLLIFCLVGYQALSAPDTDGSLTDLQWWLLFSSVCLILASLVVLLFSDPEQTPPPGTVELNQAGQVVAVY